MGKITGFMDYSRRDVAEREPAQRVRDWEEFHLPLAEDLREKQGARCMNCGVPFCQAGIIWEGAPFGCPLHNLIPEWNDMIMSGNWSHALARLLKTNNFPEFTGRVCPAPCERACLCRLYEDSVTIRDNELCVIEKGFALGKVKPRFAPHRSGQRVAVVGSGPAGLAVADQLNHRGHSVTIIEREDRPGGLLTYGIPNMKLPKEIVQRRIDLMTQEGVTFVTGQNAANPKVAKRLLEEYDAIVLCCGAEAPRPLGVDWQGVSGVCYAADFLKAAVQRQQFGLEPEIPTAAGRDVIVIGTGDTASDCAATALRQGCKSVTQLVRRKREDYLNAEGTLPSGYAQEEVQALFGQDPRRFAVQVKELVRDGSGALSALVTTDGDTLPCQLLIAATGAVGCREDVCKSFGVEMDRTVRTAEGSYQTSEEKVFAAGDMRRGQSLVVWAIAEGRAAAVQVDRFLSGYTNLK